MNVREIAEALGASEVIHLPRTPESEPDALALVQAARPDAGRGARPRRSRNTVRAIRRQISLSPEAWARLEAYAADASTPERRVTPTQIAAEIVERTVAGASFPPDNRSA